MQAEVSRQRKLVQDVLYPYLLKNTKTITEAKKLCYEVSTALTTSFQTKMAEDQKRLSEMPTSEFVIVDITKKGEGFKVNKGLYDLLKGEKLNVSDNLLRGLMQVIGSFVEEEVSKRHLKTLKATFLS